MDKRFQSVEAMIRLWVLEEEERQREIISHAVFLKALRRCCGKK